MKFFQYAVIALVCVSTMYLGAACRNGVCSCASATIKRIAVKQVTVRRNCRKRFFSRSQSCHRRIVAAKKLTVRIGTACRNGMSCYC